MTRWLALLAILGLVTTVRSDEAKKDAPSLEAVMKIWAEIGKPGEEHKKLQPLAGSWDYTAKFWMDPSQPPMESHGTIERKWILGDRFLEERVTGTGFDGKTPFEGRGVMGYDNAQKKFTAGWICSMGTSLSTSQGVYDSSDQKFTFHKEEYCPIRQQKIKSRDEIRIESNDKNVMAMYEMSDGKETKMMELVSTRKK